MTDWMSRIIETEKGKSNITPPLDYQKKKKVVIIE